YLAQLNMFRVVACAGAVGQHAILWTFVTGTSASWGIGAVLHFSRYAFFFLVALLATYAQVTRARSLKGFWVRRYVQLGVPFLFWSAAYLVFEFCTEPGSIHQAGHYVHDYLLAGYDQLYFVVVVFQYFAVLPLLLWVLKRFPRLHGWFLALSVAVALVMAVDLHYRGLLGWVATALDHIARHEPWSRNLLTYQLYFFCGTLAAIHLDEVNAFVRRHQRRILVWSFVGLGAAVAWYGGMVGLGRSSADASDPYQPFDILWYGAAIAGLLALGIWWNDRRLANGVSLKRSRVVCLADLTGGVFFCHVLVINEWRYVIGKIGLRSHLSWEETALVLYLGTVALSGAFVWLALQTPVRWILTGPVRASQRARLEAMDDDRPPGPEVPVAPTPSLVGGPTGTG
ncbi:MAG: acyltransferase family protein, partial [Acidimicrobiales bacterium]